MSHFWPLDFSQAFCLSHVLISLFMCVERIDLWVRGRLYINQLLREAEKWFRSYNGRLHGIARLLIASMIRYSNYLQLVLDSHCTDNPNPRNFFCWNAIVRNAAWVSESISLLLFCHSSLRHFCSQFNIAYRSDWMTVEYFPIGENPLALIQLNLDTTI